MTRSRRKRRTKASTPRAIASEPVVVIDQPEDPGLNLAALQLPANSDVAVRDATREHTKGAHRKDVFELLSIRKRGPKRDLPPLLSTELVRPVRVLEQDVHLAAGVANTQDGDRRGGSGCQERITQRHIDASRRVCDVIGLMPVQHGQLALALLAPETQGSVITRWRATVERITGKRDEEAQADVILWLCGAVAEAYRTMDYAAGERRRA